MEMDQTVRRLEWIEAEALAEFHRAAPGRARAAMDLQLDEVDGTLVSLAGNGGNVVINRAIGLGVVQPATMATLDRIKSLYADAGVSRYLLHLSTLGLPEDLPYLVAEAGFVHDRAWMKFARSDLPIAQRITELDIREIGVENAADFGRIVAAAFDLGEPAQDALAGLVERPGWHVYMSFADDTPVGAGSMFVKDGVAWVDWGATDPAFRRRGSQSALLACRIAAAIELGCSLLGACTGEAVPGDEQVSYHNILRSGFEEFGLRENVSLTGRTGGL